MSTQLNPDCRLSIIDRRVHSHVSGTLSRPCGRRGRRSGRELGRVISAIEALPATGRRQSVLASSWTARPVAPTAPVPTSSEITVSIDPVAHAPCWTVISAPADNTPARPPLRYATARVVRMRMHMFRSHQLNDEELILRYRFPSSTPPRLGSRRQMFARRRTVTSCSTANDPRHWPW
ncbi:MAG: hypothetical protein J07HR59_00770 [Halorubrum sp. J07HR59]|nr:MAG: hypothetical protein J07HR59_00770 [Halorubrum sp. J07HR59]